MKERRVIKKRKGEVVRHWPMSFWVRGGDKTGSMVTQSSLGGGGHTIGERMLVSCVCATETVQLGEEVEGGWGVSLPWVFRLATLPTDIYWTTSHTQSAST